MSKHTPAPWFLTPLFTTYGMLNNEGSIVVMHGSAPDAADTAPIAHALLTIRAKRGQAHKTQDPVRDANARLIAAAPELLAALQAVVDDPTEQALSAAERAIAKATGN